MFSSCRKIIHIYRYIRMFEYRSNPPKFSLSLISLYVLSHGYNKIEYTSWLVRKHSGRWLFAVRHTHIRLNFFTYSCARTVVFIHFTISRNYVPSTNRLAYLYATDSVVIRVLYVHTIPIVTKKRCNNGIPFSETNNVSSWPVM